MIPFPRLQMLSAPDTQIPVHTGLRFGTSAEVDVRLRSSHINPIQAGIFFEHERWWLRDLGSQGGIVIDAQVVAEGELKHGTVFELSRGFIYEFQEHEPDVPPVSPEMEASIIAAPDDEQRWSVYADWLEERGSLKHFGAFLHDARLGEFRVTSWQHGLARAILFRATWGDHADWSYVRRLQCLSRVPSLRFVRTIELALGTFLRRAVDDPRAVQLAIDSIGPLPFFDELIVSPCQEFEIAQAPGRTLRVKLEKPKPATVTLVNHRRDSPVSLQATTPSSARVPLIAGTPRVLPGGCQLVLEGPNARNAGLRHIDGLWMLEGEHYRSHGLMLNDRQVTYAFLRTGDVIELVPGVTLNFSA